MKEPIKMEKKLRLFEMFAGYGGASFALKKAEVDFVTVGYSEIDKFAIQCYDQNHSNIFNIRVPKFGDMPGSEPIHNFGDCTTLDVTTLPDFDLLTGGFPCQAFSVAGKGLGELDTRGTLFYDIIRVAEHKKPRFMLLENVKGLTNKKHRATFAKVCSELDRIGYGFDWAVLNSKDFGIPQNRERVFFVCFRDSEDWEAWQGFPEKEELKLFLKDVLEGGFVDRDTSYCIDANYFKGTNVEQYLKKHRRQIVFSCPLKMLNRNQRNYPRDYSMCVDTVNTNGVYRDGVFRKLTPTECFRLMGFLDDEIKLNGISNTQRYKLAGNGWEINLVSKIFKKMFQDKKQEN